MRIPSGAPGGRMRFDYRGMHRYLITLIPHPSCHTLAERETVLAVLAELRESCRMHEFELYAYCFLPRKLVMLARGKSESSDMKKFLADLRARSDTSFAERTGHHLWARKYQERVLRKAEITRSTAEEIFRLPFREGLVSPRVGYEFQGSFVLPRIGSVPSPRTPVRRPRRKAGHSPFTRHRPGGGSRRGPAKPR